MEVNTGGVFRGWRSTFYPAPFLLRRAMEKGMRATISADAHCAEALCFGFAAREMLRCAGFLQCVDAAGAAPFAKRRCEKRCARAQNALRKCKCGVMMKKSRPAPPRALPRGGRLRRA